MKKTHIIILVFIAAAIVVLISYTGDLTTYETIASARQKEGKFVNLIAKIDMQQPLEYDAVKNPNYLSFTAVDTLGNSIKVIYHNNMRILTCVHQVNDPVFNIRLFENGFNSRC